MGRPEKPPSSAYSLFRFVIYYQFYLQLKQVCQLSWVAKMLWNNKKYENKKLNKKKGIKKETLMMDGQTNKMIYREDVKWSL